VKKKFSEALKNMANCIRVNDLKIFKKMYFFLDKI